MGFELKIGNWGWSWGLELGIEIRIWNFGFGIQEGAIGDGIWDLDWDIGDEILD